jgi:hypothetical protein
MKHTSQPQWTYNEFLAFLLLYAAHADLKVTEEEKEMLLEKISGNDYEHIRRKFMKENDYQRLQTILSCSDFYKDEASKDQLLKDLRDMFLADEKYTSIEKAVFMGLRRILQ